MPASERVEVSYACEESGCDFATANEGEARVHRGRAHAVRGEQVVDDLVFLRFDSEADFDAFAAATRGEEADEVGGRWAGPGWYGKRHERRPCGRGCCSMSVLKLTPIGDVCADWRQQAEYFGAAADRLDALIAAANGGASGAGG